MRRRVVYHNDGTVRMDYYTFSKIPLDKVARWAKRKPVRSYRGTGKVREFK